MSVDSSPTVNSLIRLEPEADDLWLRLPAPSDTVTAWPSLEQSLQSYLKLQADRWPSGSPVRLAVQDRLLDVRQLQAIAGMLKEINLELQWVKTSRRQTAIAAATVGYCVEQTSQTSPLKTQAVSSLAKPLILKNTVRSGVEIRHPGDVFLIGDVNPGGEIIADGDILIWGTLRGTAHAGFRGDTKAIVQILRLAASQIRIADRVARVSAEEVEQGEPEVAYITSDGIRLTSARNFKKIK
ncbi:MAG: septum site-determining protein MinC [Microcystaceae cyanobacterium]